MWKKTLKVFVGFVLSIIALAIFLIFYYQFDEDLTPDVVEVLEYKPVEINVSENGYFHLLGIFGAEDKNPHDHGVYIVGLAREKYDDGDNFEIFSLLDDEGLNQIKPETDSEAYCTFKNDSCLSLVRGKKEAVESLLSKNQILLDRFKTLYQYQEFQETPYIFGFSGVIKAHNFVLTSIANSWVEGKKNEALASLNRDLSFWRKASSSDISLITRMIVVAMIIHDLELWSDLVSDCHDCAQHDLVLSSLAEPFSKNELSLRKVLGLEFRHQTYLFERAFEDGKDNELLEKSFVSLAYKPNSLLNKIFLAHKNMIELSECDISQYLRCHAEYIEKSNNLPDYFSWAFIDDPVGSILQALATPAYHGYAKVHFENEARRRMILVKGLIYRNYIKRDKLQTYLETLPEQYRDPFTGTPIQYDSLQDALVIEHRGVESIHVSLQL